MDPATIGGLLSAGGGIAAGLFGQGRSIDMSREDRNWQQYMSNTAHQREMADLEAAGLNPILSAGGSGASTPGGSTPGLESLSGAVSKGMDTAIALKSQKKDFEYKDSQIGNTDADTQNKYAVGQLTKAQAESTKQNTVNAKLTTDSIKLQNELAKQTLPAAIKKAKAEGDWSEVNQIMGIIKTGTSSAADLMGGSLTKALGSVLGQPKPEPTLKVPKNWNKQTP